MNKRLFKGKVETSTDKSLELEELDRAQKEEETTIAALTEEFDEIEVRMDADHELAVRMTHEEQEIYAIEERARFLTEYFERRKKQLAAKRVKEIRNKPPTRTQVRNRMITYLKHMVEPESKDKKGKRIKRVADSAPNLKSSKKQKMMQEQESVKSDEEESADYKQENKELRIIHTLLMDGTLNCFNLLIEKRYSLIKEMLEKMLNWKLEAEAESTMAFELLKFIKSQIKE
nr:hypothetical protein [Tanacetum cinerariifolium]